MVNEPRYLGGRQGVNKSSAGSRGGLHVHARHNLGDDFFDREVEGHSPDWRRRVADGLGDLAAEVGDELAQRAAQNEGEQTRTREALRAVRSRLVFPRALGIRLLQREPVSGLLDHVQQTQHLGGGRRSGPLLDLGHGFLRKMRLEEGAHVKPFPPAIQNQAAGLPAGFLPAIAESHLLAEAAAPWKDILVMFRQHGQSLRLPMLIC